MTDGTHDRCLVLFHGTSSTCDFTFKVNMEYCRDSSLDTLLLSID